MEKNQCLRVTEENGAKCLDDSAPARLDIQELRVQLRTLDVLFNIDLGFRDH